MTKSSSSEKSQPTEVPAAPKRLLDGIGSPADIKALREQDLPQLAQEVRDELIKVLSQTGGHLGPNLGVVELTIALHRVFDSPSDRIVFDIGHQSYVHKLLTGRQQEFDTLRAAGGLAGYPQRDESPHDHVQNSHSSTALSYADGLARAQRLLGEKHRRVVAVIGDGALTGGIAWEALNNLGSGGGRVVMVLNDNGRSYAPTVGGLASHLAALRTGRHTGPNLFQTLGLDYVGPVDGHDIAAVEAAFQRAATLEHPVVVHCVTDKGRGYRPAETDEADRMHGVGVIDPVTGTAPATGSRGWTSAFGTELAEVAAARPDVV